MTQRTTDSHHLSMAMPPVPEWAVPQAQDMEHLPPSTFSREWACKMLSERGETHKAGRGDNRNLLPHDWGLH